MATEKPNEQNIELCLGSINEKLPSAIWEYKNGQESDL